MTQNIFLIGMGIGATIVVIFFILWSINKYFKKRISSDRLNKMPLETLPLSEDEGRAGPRAPVAWDVILDTSQGAIEGRFKDINLGGGFISCDNPLPLNKTFSMAIQRPNKDLIHLTGEVIWSNANVPEKQIVTRGMGIRFIENSSEDRLQLARALSDVSDVDVKNDEESNET